jgi:signal transduction histidine kinase
LNQRLSNVMPPEGTTVPRDQSLEELKRELAEAHRREAAAAEVLRAIRNSPSQLLPVLNVIVSTATRLCSAEFAFIAKCDDGKCRLVAANEMKPEHLRYLEGRTIAIDRTSVTGRVAIDRRTIQVADVLADPEFKQHEWQSVGRQRTVLGVPLLGDRGLLGVIILTRTSVAPFSDKQVEMIQTFADQAVIAIENTRLFEEVQARTRELARTVEELEIASQHKSQFVANMSHELRTPLAAILGYAELMQEGFYEPLGQKSMDALTRIRSNGKHLLGLINTVLDIAKIESGQFSLNLGEYAIENVVETVRAATESLAETKKLGLRTDVSKRLPVGVGDEQRLTQVLLNLVGNAIKFTDAGEVRITAGAANGHLS